MTKADTQVVEKFFRDHINFSGFKRHASTAVKVGIIGGVTAATYFGINGLEELATNQTLQDGIDLIQSMATISVPYVMAHKYLRGEEEGATDHAVARYGVKIAAMLGMPELIQDLGFWLSEDSMEQYQSVIADNADYIKAVAASFPFWGAAKRALRKGIKSK